MINYPQLKIDPQTEPPSLAHMMKLQHPSEACTHLSNNFLKDDHFSQVLEKLPYVNSQDLHQIYIFIFHYPKLIVQNSRESLSIDCAAPSLILI